jgi:hypothetical protein
MFYCVCRKLFPSHFKERKSLKVLFAHSRVPCVAVIYLQAASQNPLWRKRTKRHPSPPSVINPTTAEDENLHAFDASSFHPIPNKIVESNSSPAAGKQNE